MPRLSGKAFGGILNRGAAEIAVHVIISANKEMPHDFVRYCCNMERNLLIIVIKPPSRSFPNFYKMNSIAGVADIVIFTDIQRI